MDMHKKADRPIEDRQTDTNRLRGVQRHYNTKAVSLCQYDKYRINKKLYLAIMLV
jgi:hypothetical protein